MKVKGDVIHFVGKHGPFEYELASAGWRLERTRPHNPKSTVRKYVRPANRTG